MVNIRPATLEDIEFFATKLMDDDREECRYLLEMEGYDALFYSYNESSECYSLEINGIVSCLFGCAPVGDGALFWLLLSKDVTSLPRDFFRKSKIVIQELLSKYSFLENNVDSNKKFVIHLCKWVGFKIGAPKPYGKDGKLYCNFRIERSV